MDKKLLKWFYTFHVVQGNKVTTKDFKKKHWIFQMIQLLKHLKDGFKNLKKDIILN